MKQKFIKAYCYCYGSTVKEAKKVYKKASKDYIDAIIESMQRDVIHSFYCD